jgi:uncharacterized protein YaaN involved in tellurite resistance
VRIILKNLQCFENNKEAEKVEVNYERLKTRKKSVVETLNAINAIRLRKKKKFKNFRS